MTAGHVLLKVFGTFVVALGSFEAVPVVFGVLPLAVNVALAALELLIALIQAYVFALLASLYLNDAINLHYVTNVNPRDERLCLQKQPSSSVPPSRQWMRAR